MIDARPARSMRAVHRALLVIGLGALLAACEVGGPSPFGGSWTAITAAGIDIETKSEAPHGVFQAGCPAIDSVSAGPEANWYWRSLPLTCHSTPSEIGAR
jgi:hypothetical protein